jgi:hypothetical protein
MKRYIKKLNEAEDLDDLDSFWNSLDDLIGPTFYGWAFLWESLTENPLAEVIIASSPKEALSVYTKYGWFGEDIHFILSAGKSVKTISDVFEHLVKQKIIYNSSIVFDLRLRENIEQRTGYIRIPRDNPYNITRNLNRVFYNAEERFDQEFDSSKVVTNFRAEL